MTKEEFLQEVTLRLIAAKPQASVDDIAFMAKDITRQVFNAVVEMEMARTSWWDTILERTPIAAVTSHIESKWRVGGYGAKLSRIFKENDIKTVGNLLKLGRDKFRKIRNVGCGSLTHIDEALEDLYDIKGW